MWIVFIINCHHVHTGFRIVSLILIDNGKLKFSCYVQSITNDEKVINESGLNYLFTWPSGCSLKTYYVPSIVLCYVYNDKSKDVVFTLKAPVA